MRNYFKLLKPQKGFTLIELLVVIGILGILAATVLVAINPLEQFARGRDSGRLTTVDQVGHAIQGNYTNSGAYVLQNATWLDSLVNSQDVKVQPVNPTYTANGATYSCTLANDNNYCYGTNATNEAIVYTRAESRSNCIKAQGLPPVSTCPNQNQAWIVWSSALGKTGLMYGAAPAIGYSGNLW